MEQTKEKESEKQTNKNVKENWNRSLLWESNVNLPLQEHIRYGNGARKVVTGVKWISTLNAFITRL
jgi:hypothetical protein